MTLKSNFFKYIFIFFLFITSLFVYTFSLNKIPSGFHGDEAELSLFSQHYLDSGLKAIVGVGQHNHPLISFIPQMISFKIFGPSMWSARLSSAIFSTLSVPLFFILVSYLFKAKVAFFSSLLFMTSHIWIAMSRLAINNSQVVFFELLTFYFLFLALRTKKLVFFIALGLGCAMMFYLYAGFRVVPIIVFIILIKELFRYKLLLLKGIVIVFIAFSFFSFPQLIFFIKNDTAFTAREDSIFIFSNSAEATEWRNANYKGLNNFEIVLEQTKKTFMLSNPKDTGGQYGYPFNILDPVTSILVILGIFISLFLFYKSEYLLTIISFLATMVTGNILAIDPFFLPRATGAIPFVYIFAGLSLDKLLSIRFNKYIRNFSLLLISLFFCFFFINNLKIYFKDSEEKMYGDRNKYTATKIGYYVRKHSNKNLVFFTIPVIYSDFDPIRFIAQDGYKKDYIHDITNPYSYIPTPVSRTDFIVLPIYRDILEKIKKVNPNGKEIIVKNRIGIDYFIYQIQ